MEEATRPTWEKVLRPLIYSDLLSNIAFVVAVVVVALVAIGLYKLVTRLAGIGGKPQPMEEAEETETERAETEEEAEDEPPEDSAEDDAEEVGESDNEQ